MNQSLKAVLLSALVYPGSGHIIFKKYMTGGAFACLFTVPLFVILSDTLARANSIVTQIERGEIPLDITAITNAVTIGHNADIQALSVYVYVLLITWVISILDVYRVSRLNPKEA